MGAVTKIQWCHHTFNGWIGCTEAGPECDHCYAREQNKHWKWNGGEWGAGALRKITGSAKWREPLKWNRDAEEAKERRRVFAFSLADVADAEAPQEAYPYLWALVESTPWLDWLFLTKRPARIVKIVPRAWLEKPPKNVWWGTSVGTQKSADTMVPALLRTPAAVRFLSCEPLLEAVDLTRLYGHISIGGSADLCVDALAGKYAAAWAGRDSRPDKPLAALGTGRIDQVIVGGESGHGARPFDLAWARSILAQCKAAQVPVFLKQVGARPVFEKMVRVERRGTVDAERQLVSLHIRDRHGGDPERWPADLRVREFPQERR